MVVINTKRFKLKPLTYKNITKKYLSWFNNSKTIKKYIVFAKKSLTITDLIKYLRSKEKKNNVLFLGIFTKSGAHIGNLKYEPILYKKRSATMGILIGDKKWRGKRVAPEVIKASNNFLNKFFGIKYIYLGVQKDNTPAISVYKKMNFRIIRKNTDTLKMRLNLK